MANNWQTASDTLKEIFQYKRIGLIIDMDGTISPIVPVFNDAQPTARNRQLLATLHDQLALVAVMSGRAATDLRERVGLPQLVYVGNHGIERWQNNQIIAAPDAIDYRPKLEAAISELKERMPEDMRIEDKHISVSVHFREAPNAEEIGRNYRPMVFEIAEENGLRLFDGRLVFELRPALEINKGTIFEDLVQEYNLQAALYIGDDATDADALKKAKELRQSQTCFSFGIGVLSDETPPEVLESSDFLVDGVEGVERFLDWFANSLDASAT
jgi:trehalose 6-phosphate phosphatase